MCKNKKKTDLTLNIIIIFVINIAGCYHGALTVAIPVILSVTRFEDNWKTKSLNLNCEQIFIFTLSLIELRFVQSSS